MLLHIFPNRQNLSHNTNNFDGVSYNAKYVDEVLIDYFVSVQ
jgi:hypothetical protein